MKQNEFSMYMLTTYKASMLVKMENKVKAWSKPSGVRT